MRDYQLILDPFSILNMLDCKMLKQVGEHAKLYVSGYIDPQNEEDYLRISLTETPIVLLAVNEFGDTKPLFCGLSQDVRIRAEGKLRRLEVEAVSYSFYMDMKNKIRIFQNAASLYEDILKYFEAGYGEANHIMTVGVKEPINKLIVQYHETDWTFAKRLASHFNSVIVPAYLTNSFSYYFGMPEGKDNINLTNDVFIIKKTPGDYLRKIKNGANNMIESDAYYLEIESREIYEIGDRYTFKEQRYYIYQIESNLIGAELIHIYRLKTKGGLQETIAYNEMMIGASMEAAITNISKDTVQVKVQADGIQTPAKWFPYSTVYSSPDGTGWYCMPEVGDSVRLYMPSDREDEGYIISAVHESGGGDARTNPDNKSLKSKYGKEVLFTPTSLLITNNNGMSVEIVDEEGIKIISDKAIVIQSDESIQIASAKDSVAVIAQETIALQQGDTSLTLEEEIHLTGAQVHME